MSRWLSRFVFVLVLLAPALIGSSGRLPAVAAFQGPEFTAASVTPISQTGQVGRVYMNTLPTVCLQHDPVTNVIDEYVSFGDFGDNPLGVRPTAAGGMQKILVRQRVYQRLSNGTFQYLLEDPNASSVNTQFQTSLPIP